MNIADLTHSWVLQFDNKGGYADVDDLESSIRLDARDWSSVASLLEKMDALSGSMAILCDVDESNSGCDLNSHPYLSNHVDGMYFHSIMIYFGKFIMKGDFGPESGLVKTEHLAFGLATDGTTEDNAGMMLALMDTDVGKGLSRIFDRFMGVRSAFSDFIVR